MRMRMYSVWPQTFKGSMMFFLFCHGVPDLCHADGVHDVRYTHSVYDVRYAFCDPQFVLG
jgi:hypothetical protein